MNKQLENFPEHYKNDDILNDPRIKDEPGHIIGFYCFRSRIISLLMKASETNGEISKMIDVHKNLAVECSKYGHYLLGMDDEIKYQLLMTVQFDMPILEFLDTTDSLGNYAYSKSENLNVDEIDLLFQKYIQEKGIMLLTNNFAQIALSLFASVCCRKSDVFNSGGYIARENGTITETKDTAFSTISGDTKQESLQEKLQKAKENGFFLEIDPDFKPL